MKILSIDTASNLCGVAILEDTNLITNSDIITTQSHSIRLMPIIKDVFDRANLQLTDIDLVVCDKGPGSFTGIRIGVSTSKAFCDSLSIPSIGVSSLEALAYNVDKNGLICSLIDAKNENCYFSFFRKSDNLKYEELLEPNNDNINTILEILNSYNKNNEQIIFVGDGSILYKDIIQKSIENSMFLNEELNSYNLALAGYSKFINNVESDILPMYLRKPQAQRQLEEKLNGNKI